MRLNERRESGETDLFRGWLDRIVVDGPPAGEARH